MKLHSRFAIGVFAVASAALLSSCSEKLDNEAACPILCPGENGAVENVTLDATTFDTTIVSERGVGTELGMLIANRGDSLDTRAIIRFDTLPATFQPVLSDTATKPVTRVDSALLALHVDTTSLKITGLVTIEAYDVDTTISADSTRPDTATAPLLALFRPDRLIASHSYARSEIHDTLSYSISDSAVLNKITTGRRLRIGLRAVSSASAQLRIFSTEAAEPPNLHYRVSPDTAVQAFVVSPYSETPFGDATTSGHLGDFTIVAKSPAPAPPQTLNMGGLPATRIYMRFELPSYIVDSSTVVRAALVLTQIPNRTIDPGDSVTVSPALVLATNVVVDPAKAAQILGAIPLNPVSFAVGDSGQKTLELGPAFSFWKGVDPKTTPRAIVLRSSYEGVSPLQARFFSIEAAPALRPKLLISYIRRTPLGLP